MDKMSNNWHMQFQDEAIILSARRFGERDLICQFFTKTRGIYGGFVRAGQSRKKIANFEAGNVAQISWKARLDDQLGTVEAEVTNAIGGHIISDMKRLMAVLSASVLLRKTLAERDPQTALYNEFHEFLKDDDWKPAYVKFELALLRELGFGLDLTECAVTGSRDNLIYISPASGRAVTAQGAVGYEDKMLNLPNILRHSSEGWNLGSSDSSLRWNDGVKEALSVTEFFLMRNVFAPHNWNLPEERQRLRKIVG